MSAAPRTPSRGAPLRARRRLRTGSALERRECQRLGALRRGPRPELEPLSALDAVTRSRVSRQVQPPPHFFRDFCACAGEGTALRQIAAMITGHGHCSPPADGSSWAGEASSGPSPFADAARTAIPQACKRSPEAASGESLEFGCETGRTKPLAWRAGCRDPDRSSLI
jgi:hypothetical protein